MMKRNLLMLCGIIIFSNLNILGQSSLCKINIEENKYFIDTTEFNIVSVDLVNVRNIDLILWMDRCDITKLTDEQKIKHYFFRAKGDFSFAQVVNENIIGELPIILYTNFVKKISAGNSFSFKVLLKKKCDIERVKVYFEERLVCIEASLMDNYLNIASLEDFFYEQDSIVLSFETLK